MRDKSSKRKDFWWKKIICDVNVGNIFISKLVETKTNSNYMAWYLDKVIRPSVLVLLKWVNMSRHLKLKMEIKIRLRLRLD